MAQVDLAPTDEDTIRDEVLKNLIPWLQANPLATHEVDCAIAVMLKILDGKCKMKADEKIVMAALYQAVKDNPSDLFGEDIHAVIRRGNNDHSETMKLQIYETRVLAETQISRPVMKAFKARIRQAGIFSCLPSLPLGNETHA